MTDNILYHYCSLDSFCQITKKGTLRFSDITKSNDSDEIKFMFDIYVRYLEDKYRDIAWPSKDKLNEEIKKTLERKKIYCFCLSKSEDDLSQWRGYAPNGGIAIGFDGDMLKKYSKTISVQGETVKLEKVEYMDKGNPSERYSHFEKPNYDHETPVKNIAEVLKISPQYKNIGFKAENEYRLYFPNYLPPFGTLPLPSISAGGISYSVDFKLSENGTMRSYYELPFPYEMVKKIWIGPKLPHSVDTVATFIERYHSGLNIEILRTELTYR